MCWKVHVEESVSYERFTLSSNCHTSPELTFRLFGVCIESKFASDLLVIVPYTTVTNYSYSRPPRVVKLLCTSHIKSIQWISKQRIPTPTSSSLLQLSTIIIAAMVSTRKLLFIGTLLGEIKDDTYIPPVTVIYMALTWGGYNNIDGNSLYSVEYIWLRLYNRYMMTWYAESQSQNHMLCISCVHN